MKKNRILLLFALAAGLFAFSGCSEEDDNGTPEGTHLVSKEVQNAFNAKYPQARDVEWELKGNYAVVDFDWNGAEHSAWFDPSSASWYMTETDIRYADVPQAVRTAHEAGKYAGWHVDDVDMLTREGMETLYVIEVEKGKTEVDLFYSPSGVLVKSMVDADAEKGYDDYLPKPDAEGIVQAVKEKYPNARIVDIERENGMTEVEIVDGMICRDVYFNNSGSWLYTKTEVSPNAVPAAVKAALAASVYASYHIDDVDFYESTDGGNYYRYELDSREGDIKIDISEDGSVLTEAGNNGGQTPEGNGSGNMVDAAIKALIENKYAGAVILEREYEHGLLEVDILHGGIVKEVCFDGRNEWIKTTWDVKVSSLPDAVKQAVKAKYPAYVIDDADQVETAAGDWYELELEDESTDRELHARIKADGTWLE